MSVFRREMTGIDLQKDSRSVGIEDRKPVEQGFDPFVARVGAIEAVPKNEQPAEHRENSTHYPSNPAAFRGTCASKKSWLAGLDSRSGHGGIAGRGCALDQRERTQAVVFGGIGKLECDIDIQAGGEGVGRAGRLVCPDPRGKSRDPEREPFPRRCVWYRVWMSPG